MRKVVISATTFTWLLAALGCMSFSFGGRTEVASPHEPAGIATDWSEHGSATVPPGEEIIVYYPVPYASPPNLVIHDKAGLCRVVEQKADFFRVRNNASIIASDYEVRWTARGVKALPQPAPAAAPTTSPVLANPVPQ